MKKVKKSEESVMSFLNYIFILIGEYIPRLQYANI